MAQQMTEAQARRMANRRRHWQERHERQAARGPRGIAASWWDRARMIAAAQEEMARAAGESDPEAAWNELARWLENFCARYEQ